MQKNQILLKCFIIGLVLLVAIIGGPMVIKGCYNSNTSYTVNWDATVVLSYYEGIISAVIGAMITMLALYFTISFNRRQIQRDSYLHNEKKKWKEIESNIETVLDLINPQRIISLSVETSLNNNDMNIDRAIASIQKYQVDCRIATDKLLACINCVDYPKVESLLNVISNTAQQFFDLAQQEQDVYKKLPTLELRDLAQKILDESRVYHFSKEFISHAEKILNSTLPTCFKSICEEIESCNSDMVTAYGEKYRPLLCLKRQTFDKIQAELQKNADDILHFWAK